MKNWGLLPKENVEGFKEIPTETLEEYLTFISKHKSNAVGWAKTHDILLTPFLPKESPVTTSFLHSKQVFIHNSPEWIRETEALGPIHPKDTKKFPEEETVIEGIFKNLYNAYGCGPVGGFVEYHAGPNRVVHNYRSGGYSLRADSWYLYARSGERDIREFAQGSNRAFTDYTISHWNSDKKILGLYIGDVGSPGTLAQRNRVRDLPMFWQGNGTQYELSTVADMDQSMLDYYFTGYRRAGEILSNFSNAAKNTLTYDKIHWRALLTLKHIAQVYEVTWEPKLREVIYEINNRYMYDPEGMLLLTKQRPYRSTTYKTETDQDTLLLLWQIFKDPLFKEMATSLGYSNWQKASILPPIRGQNRATGYLYRFLWEETKNPQFLADFDYARRRLVADRLVDFATQNVKNICTSQIPRFFKGLPMAMDSVTKTEQDPINNKSSWLSFKSVNLPVSIFFIKPGDNVVGHNQPVSKNETAINILIRKESSASVEHLPKTADKTPTPAQAGGNIIIKPHIILGNQIWSGHDLHTVTERSDGVCNISIPKDAPGGVYEFVINHPGYYSIFTDKHTPLALHSTESWNPLPMNPPVRIYFNVPKDTDKGRIFFEKNTRLFTPNGEAYNDGKEVFGWVEVSKNTSGLWSFESIDPGLVKTENLPGFFSFSDPAFYMEK